VARQRAGELRRSEDELVRARREVEDLRDGLWLLRCAVDEARADLAGEAAPTARAYAGVLRSLLRASDGVLKATGTPERAAQRGAGRPRVRRST